MALTFNLRNAALIGEQFVATRNEKFRYTFCFLHNIHVKFQVSIQQSIIIKTAFTGAVCFSKIKQIIQDTRSHFHR